MKKMLAHVYIDKLRKRNKTFSKFYKSGMLVSHESNQHSARAYFALLVLFDI